MKFINIYNADGTNNSLLNVEFIAKIDNGVPPVEIKNEKFYQIEYFLGYRFEEAHIKEKDYLELTSAQVKVKPEAKKEENKENKK